MQIVIMLLKMQTSYLTGRVHLKICKTKRFCALKSIKIFWVKCANPPELYPWLHFAPLNSQNKHFATLFDFLQQKCPYYFILFLFIHSIVFFFFATFFYFLFSQFYYFFPLLKTQCFLSLSY